MSTRATLAFLASLAVMAATAAPALASDEPEPDQPIAVDIFEGIDWTLSRQAVDGELAELPHGVTVTLRLEDGSATGNGGCNHYFARYARDGESLSFEAIGSTEMFCPESSETEASYFANLALVTMAYSTGGSLIMAGADGEPVLEYLLLADEPMPTDAIEGLVWQLESLATVEASEQTALPAGLVVTMLLEAGVAGGDGGCNRWSADYRLDGSALAFGPVLSTKMACPDPVMEIESAFFQGLGSVAGWSSDGASLVLFDESGAELGRFIQSGLD